LQTYPGDSKSKLCARELPEQSRRALEVHRGVLLKPLTFSSWVPATLSYHRKPGTIPVDSEWPVWQDDGCQMKEAMAKFTTRVQLKSPSSDAYQRLNVEMQSCGFSRMIESGDGRFYVMPEAEYDFLGEVERKDVLERAKSAVSKAGVVASILVTESKGRIWYGLEPTR
jgi:hypothetical protein